MNHPQADADPYSLLSSIVNLARGNDPSAPLPMALATASSSGTPSLRMVLLKDIDPARGLSFFTNYSSEKGRNLSENPFAEVLLFYPDLGRQIRARGRVTRASAERSQIYWESRPRESQLSGAASKQSRPIASREVLESQLRSVTQASFGAPVPRPDDWGGYDLLPDRWEFWSEGEHRLHDRVLFTRGPSGLWTRQLLQP